MLLRPPAFFYTSAGLDEGLYFLMAHNLLAGHLPYTQTFDNKPPGIYLIFATAMLAFGRTTFAIRIASCLAIALGAYAMYLLGRRDGAERGGVDAAYGYVLYTSHLSGLEANTEIFFMPLTVLAFALVWPTDEPGPRGRVRALGAGLLFGLGACINSRSSSTSRPRSPSSCSTVARASGNRWPCWPPAPCSRCCCCRFRSRSAGSCRRSIGRRSRPRPPRGLGISVGQNALRILEASVTLFPLFELLVVAPLVYRSPRAGAALRRTIAIGALWFAVDSVGVLALGDIEAHWILPLVSAPLLVGSATLWGGAGLLSADRRPRQIAVAIALASVALFRHSTAGARRRRQSHIGSCGPATRFTRIAPAPSRRTWRAASGRTTASSS